tara:strand:- start:346 stop:882 length:537 start_codon:yes stop_codon:yes gene_type:complete
MPFKFFIAIIFGSCLLSQDSEIIWQEHNLLVWENFKGRPDKSSSAAAVTASGISYNYGVSRVGDRVVGFDATVITHFYPEKSWCKKELINEHILQHEQFHFNITELHSRLLRKTLSELKANPELVSQITGAYKAINIELQKFQELYDSETDYSRNYEVQKEWELKVSKQLLALNAFGL